MVVFHIIELYHHGIKGQRWGVRRFQNKDGSYTPAGIKRYQIGLNKIANKAVDRSQFINSRVIPKGTKIYRTTADDGDEKQGSTYVSYLEADRNHYKGGWIRATGKTGKAYEREYSLNEDIKVPSRNEVKEVIKDAVLKNKKLVKESIKSWVDMALPKGSCNRKLLESYYRGGIKKYTKDMIKSMSDRTIDEAYYKVCQSLGLAKNVKKTVISELSKRGYNAMVDEASVGGHNGYAREGVDPLILFDNGILKQVSIKEISKKEEQRAHKKDQKWQGNAQRSYNRNPNGQWSAIKSGGEQFMENDFLQHYGVKGMKWGVRRDIAKRSLMGARIKRDLKWDLKRGNKLNAKLNKRMAKGKNTDRIAKSLSKHTERAQRTLDMYKKVTSGISKEDLAKGERALKRRRLGSMLLVGGGYTEIINRGAINRYAKKGKY